MTESSDVLKLNYTVNTLCLAEASLGKPLSAIFEEVQSDEGTSVTTLRALIAAGRLHLSPLFRIPISPGMQSSLAPFYDENGAGNLIDKHGIAICAEEVGNALRKFIAKISGDVNG